MNEVTTYTFGENKIEVIDIGNDIALSDEQIGIALGYADPAKAIANLVTRNEDELRGLSTILNLRKVEGGRTVTRSVRVWGERGVMRISFLAATEKAKEFRAWATETLYSVRHGNLNPGSRRIAGNPEVVQVRDARDCFRAALLLAKDLGLEGNQAQLNAMRIAKSRTGFDIREEYQLQLAAPEQARYLTPTDIGARLHPNRNPRQVNQLLLTLGYQEEVRDGDGHLKGYRGTEAGKPHWILVDEARQNAGGNIQTLRWYESVVPIVQEMVSAAVEAS